MLLLLGLHIWSEFECCWVDHEVIHGEMRCLTVVTRHKLDLRSTGRNFHRLFCVQELDDDEVDDEVGDECAGKY